MHPAISSHIVAQAESGVDCVLRTGDTKRHDFLVEEFM